MYGSADTSHLSFGEPYRELERLCPGGVFRDVDLAAISRWRIGGRADVVVRPRDPDELSALRGWLGRRGVPHLVIGATTNLLFSDEGLRAVCLQIGPDFARLSRENDVLRCDPGVWAPRLARAAMQAGLTGIEHICGIPGTMGGLIYMNGGSQRRGIGEAVVSVTTVDAQGGVHIRSQAECGFAYRHSAFQQTEEVIAGAILRLPGRGDPATIRREMLGIMGSRRRKFPQKEPNCGSVFVSNPAFYAEYGPPGAVIERLGFKGLRIGNAQVSPSHANFIVNLGGARASDVLALIAKVRGEVAQKTGYLMEVEARFVRPDGTLLPAGDVM